MSEALFKFIHEREMIRRRRESGAPRPWTKDTILNTYRFCNVYREHDKVTKWLTETWRKPHSNDPDIWFAFVVARHFNQIDALTELSWPVPFNPDHIVNVMACRKRQNMKVFSGAYMIGTRNHGDKTAYLVDNVFNPLWNQRETIRPKLGDTLTSWHMLLGQFYGMGSFLSAQVIADIKYVKPLLSASDWWTFAASGPGSRRGLNRVLGYPVKQPWQEDRWRQELTRLRETLIPMFQRERLLIPHAQDVQNCLCEFDKYERARLGEGRPKQIFRSVK